MRARHGGEHPTALSALDATSDHTAGDLLGVAARGVGDGFFLPFRGVGVILTDERTK